jgi:hypothetical protein
MSAAMRSHDQKTRRDGEAQDGDERIPESDTVEIQLRSFGQQELDFLVLAAQICEHFFGID